MVMLAVENFHSNYVFFYTFCLQVRNPYKNRKMDQGMQWQA